MVRRSGRFCALPLSYSCLRFLGDWSDEGTPGPISNPAVKLVSADGTWRGASWESRSLPRALPHSGRVGDNSPLLGFLFRVTLDDTVGDDRLGLFS